MSSLYQIFIRALVTCITLLVWFSSSAQIPSNTSVIASNAGISSRNNQDTSYFINPAEESLNSPKATAIESPKTVRERRKLLSYLKDLHVPENPDSYHSHQKFFYYLAGIFAHMKLYPLAMKCFLKSQVNIDSPIVQKETTPLSLADLPVSSKDDSVITVQVSCQNIISKEPKSKRISTRHINSVFNDGKTAVAYAMLFHVKQPVPGKRKIFLWTNTGHTFITLIKYNTDSSYVSASFGFYPVKDQLLSATPLSPTTSATFKDDSKHKWDEVLGKFISKRNFEKILVLTNAYADQEYNLNNNNCTDFGIQAASIAGIKVIETNGKWPLGSGNNPAVTGQSILAGDYINMDTTEFKDLFVGKE